jgi:hypothetical protein
MFSQFEKQESEEAESQCVMDDAMWKDSDPEQSIANFYIRYSSDAKVSLMLL